MVVLNCNYTGTAYFLHRHGSLEAGTCSRLTSHDGVRRAFVSGSNFIGSKISGMAVAFPVRPLARTLVIDMAGQQRRVPIATSPFAIGRSDDCDAIIPDFRVSRLHAKILQEGEQFYLVD